MNPDSDASIFNDYFIIIFQFAYRISQKFSSKKKKL